MNDFFISLALLGALSSSDGYLPFWSTANQYGLMPERSGGLTLVQANTQFDDSKTLQWRWGASMGVNAYDNPLDSGSSPVHAMLDQAYGSLRWTKFTLDLGMKHRLNEFLGASSDLGSLSVTGGHLVESGNARSMPGYLVTMEPVAVPFTGGRFLLSGAYGDYATTDNRYVNGALVHRMRIGFHLEPLERLSLSATLDHYGVWGGTSPDKGVQPNGFGAYLRVVTGSHAGSDGTMSDQINVIGDQGGSEIFKATYRGENWTLIAQHDIPYTDGSGMGFQNFPDGVNTVAFSYVDKNKWISDLLYEYHYTLCCSGPFNGERFDENGNNLTPPGVKTTGGDTYFNNWEYKSGWTHYGHVIGDPLILPLGSHSGEWSSAVTNLRIENSRYTAHHLGIGGSLFRRHPYKLLVTYSRNFGTYIYPYIGESPFNKPVGSVVETPLRQFSAAFVGELNLGRAAGRVFWGASRKGGSSASSGHASGSASRRAHLTALYGLYLDKGELYTDTAGLTLGVRYTIGG